MRLTIPITPETVPHLPALLATLSASEPGAGHQLFVLAASDCLDIAEKFARSARQKTKFGGVVMSSLPMSQMSAPYTLLWTTYFRDAHPDTLWLDPGSVIVGKDGWLTRIEDSARFSTSLFLGPQVASVTGVYRNGASKKLRTWECSCVKGIAVPSSLAGFSNLLGIRRETHLIHASDSLEGIAPFVEIVVPKTWGRPIDPLPVVKVVAPEVVEEPAPEVVKVDTEVKTEVSGAPPARIVRRTKP